MSLKKVLLASLLIDSKPGFASGDDLEEGIFQIRMNNITRDGSLDIAKRRRVRVDEKKLGSVLLELGDVLFNATNSPDLVGKSAYIGALDEPTTYSNHFVRLRSDPEKLDGSYLARWLHTLFQAGKFKGLCKQWVNQATVSRDSLLALEIPLPPLHEQRRIADILDKADALRTKRREALTQLDRLAQSIFVQMFGDPLTNPKRWPMVEIGAVADVQGGLQVTAARSRLPVEVPYLRVANVYRGRLDMREVKTIRATKSEVGRTRLLPNDMLVVEGHGNPEEVGRAALWNGEVENCVHQNHLIRVRFDSARMAPAFACAYVNSAGGRQHLLRAGKTTSGLNTISVSNVRAVPIPLPSLAAQKTYEERVAEVGRLKRVQRDAELDVDALFAAVQHRAFRGEV